MKTIHSFVAAVAVLAAGSVLCACGSSDKASQADAQQPASEQAEVTEGVITLSDDNLLRPDTKVDELTVLDFNATWCVPCKKLAPAFEKAANELSDKAKFYSVDFDKNPETAKAFGVTEVPCVVFLTPAGITETYPSLSDFITTEQLQDTTLTADQVNDIIYASLQKMVETAAN